jgi:hypothetical protein
MTIQLLKKNKERLPVNTEHKTMLKLENKPATPTVMLFSREYFVEAEKDLTFTIDMESDEGIKYGNALLSFYCDDPSFQAHADLAGLKLSQNEKIGYFTSTRCPA